MPFGGMPPSGIPIANSPSGGIPELLTSFGDFENIYGGYDDLALSTTDNKNRNYMAMAVKAFFDNGGSMLYVSRVFATKPGTAGAKVDPGVASSGTASASNVVVAARFPGVFGSQQVTVTLNATKVQNTSSLPPGSLLGVAPSGSGAPTLYSNGTGTVFESNATPPVALPSPTPANTYLLTVRVTALGANGQAMTFDNLGLDPNHPNYIGNVLGVSPPRHIDSLQNSVYFTIGSNLSTAATLYPVLFAGPWAPPTGAPAGTPGLPPTTATVFNLTNGDDGVEPTFNEYTAALQYLEPLEDVAIVAAPGYSVFGETSQDNLAITEAIIEHVERPRAYRVAILDTPPNQLASDNESTRAQIDSTYSALYVPWIVVGNPLAKSGTSIPAEVVVPPSGHMAGIYARNDVEHSVAKAPANEVLLGAVDLERHISFGEQEVLNPQGINCLRFFPDRGFRVWGARTASSNSELMYVNPRRYLIYLEHSIDNGTQWAVFENNGPALWARIKDSIDSFLYNEFVQGNLLGTSPAEAYFVRCDRTTMTQNNLDNGQLICLVGVALLKPAEFVIIRIGQMTASARS
jgi:hypothetical protein